MTAPEHGAFVARWPTNTENVLPVGGSWNSMSRTPFLDCSLDERGALGDEHGRTEEPGADGLAGLQRGAGSSWFSWRCSPPRRS